MFARFVALIILVGSVHAHAQAPLPVEASEDGAIATTPAPIPASTPAESPARPAAQRAQPAPAEPSLQDIADQLAAAHLEAEGDFVAPPAPIVPEERLEPGGITRGQLALRQGVPGLLTAGAFTFLSFTAFPMTLVLLPLMPVATAGMVQAIGDASGGQARYGYTLLGSLGGLSVGVAAGVMFGTLAIGKSDGDEYGEGDGFGNLVSGAIVLLTCTTLGTAAGAVMAYGASDRGERRRKERRLKLTPSATPLAHGAIAGLSGRF